VTTTSASNQDLLMNNDISTTLENQQEIDQQEEIKFNAYHLKGSEYLAKKDRDPVLIKADIYGGWLVPKDRIDLVKHYENRFEIELIFDPVVDAPIEIQKLVHKKQIEIDKQNKLTAKVLKYSQQKGKPLKELTDDYAIISINKDIEETKENIKAIEKQIKYYHQRTSFKNKEDNQSEVENTEELEDENQGLTKARASARRRTLISKSPFDEIVQDIRKHHPKVSNQADDIALNALIWADKYAANSKVLVNGIPKTITDMQHLDERFAQLEAPGQPCVTIHRSDAQPISLTDFNKRLSGEVVIVGVDQKGQPKYLSASTYWIGNTNKRIYRNIAFTNKLIDENTYNLYTGLGLNPLEGDCTLIFKHIYEVICAGSQENYEALIKLFAWQIQNIGKPSRIITIFKSLVQQVGKGTVLADIMVPIYGNSGFMTSDIGQILTRFNDTLRGKAYIFLDEALFAGDRKSADAIKSMSTTTRMGVETKGLPTVQFPIAVNFFLTTNHDDAAFIEETDARYWILEVSPHRAKDYEYFNNLYEEINNGGKEAFLHYLLNTDVSDFCPARDVPLNNEAKAAMIRNSINPYDARKWLEECCRSEMILGFKPVDSSSKLPWEPWIKGDEYVNGVFSTAYTEWQKSVKTPVAARPTPANKFGELLNKAGLIQRNDGQRFRTLPNPVDCLKVVIEMIEKSSK
jgi:hypothetical protein